MFRASNFDKLLDKATSNLRLDPDWPTILQICDLIRQNDCTPKYAIAGVKKKLYSQNPHQAMFALLTLESIVKNCGSAVHDEVASKPFCEMLRDLVKTTQHENLREKILELIQAWAFAFRNAPKYRAVQDTANILKAECYKFPPLKESDAMFSADAAPEWADGEVCHRCRVAFSLIVRRHHCRACGQVFCQQCSSKTSTLPKFGIEKEVRVCDACYDKVSRPPTSSAKLDIVDTSSDYGPTAQPQKRPGKSAEELQEEEELQLALALSQSEAEHKEKERRSRSHISVNPAPQHPTVSPSVSSVSSTPEHSAANSELSRYLDRGYWEQRVSTAAPTAPSPQAAPRDNVEPEYAKPASKQAQEDDNEDKEIDEFVSTLKSQVEIFVNRMKSNSSRGRSIANDTSVQTLFMNITAMHSRLLRYIQQQDDKRVYLESLQDKVTQIRDSRLALDTLRAEHAARMAAAAEAADRQRQMQMAAKLDAMRKKKHEYLQYQRQLALQRVQEQEREMQIRQEQQKHQYMMSANSGYYMPGVSLHQYQAPYNQPIYSQFHQMMPPATDGYAIPGQAIITNTSVPMTMSQPNPVYTHAGVAYTQGQITAQSSIPNTSIRQQMPQQMPQMMMQQMHQMRISQQAGAHQMIPNMSNGLPGQQVNGQTLQKPGQTQPNQMMPQMSVPQTTAGQPQMNPSNPMLGMQMANMRLPMMQGVQNQPQQMQNYPMSMQHPGQLPSQQNQMISQSQPMSLPGQQMMTAQSMPGQPMSMPHMLPNNPNVQGTQIPPQQIQQNKQVAMANQQAQQNQMAQVPGMSQTQGMSQGQPGMSQTQPGMPQAQPGMPQPQPGMQQPQPGMPQPQPGMPQPQPGMPQPQPGMPQPQPGMQQPHPRVQQPQPGMPQPQLGIQQSQSGVPQPQPGMSQPHSGMQQPQPGMPQPQQGSSQGHPQSMATQGHPMQMPSQGQMMQNQQMVQGVPQAPMPQLLQGHQQGHAMHHQQASNLQMQQQPHIKQNPSQNFIGAQPAPPSANSQVQPSIKSESNNTAELINFD